MRCSAWPTGTWVSSPNRGDRTKCVTREGGYLRGAHPDQVGVSEVHLEIKRGSVDFLPANRQVKTN
jgi:hypothetical protein